MPQDVIIQSDLPDLLHRGKVRDTHDLGNGCLLMVATDRISAFDVVLPTAIPQKGLVLSRLSAYWFQRTGHIVPNHLIAMADQAERLVSNSSGVSLPDELPQDIAARAMVVRKAERIDIECVVRGYITGSAWAEYRASGTVGGGAMPEGMREGDMFPQSLFTPTTKAETGHDMPMSMDEVRDMVGPELAEKLEDTSRQVYEFARDEARAHGIIIADTKMEFGLLDGELILIDELLTPDSSRFWDASGYEPGKSQPNFDKQFVRDWLLNSGWDREPPAPELPPDVVKMTTDRYIEAFERITGQAWAGVAEQAG
ncbi:MAG: phosphoribosylaminoimidazolesuccinocarboxamide synthase [Chloroflexota bacterium]|nr:phosphoribosylaminoimidazolesuccinocarboxamide synthase [Chloroflexota bacterium]MDE2941910.1 phosphoribosylaminoimidazolesuccinocarboxamide synthase [Chloroflexota bacterium]MDE3268381.1 phosphoribosylaminoimidazolesuccinocarboxamide synthase [Chloroflexota bacterium]